MKHTVVILSLLVFLSLSTQAQYNSNSIPIPAVDQRVELLSIVFRLAGNNEYNTKDNANYVKKIHDHFDRFRDHPLIRFAKLLHDSNGVGYDAVMSMAVHLTKAPDLRPAMPFTLSVPEKRWGVENAEKFVILLKSFYRDANCRPFFDSCKADYGIAEDRFKTLFKKLDLSWYYKYYGTRPVESFNIIIGLGNGGNNFGPHIDMPNGPKKVYAVIGAGSFDSAGSPLFESAVYLPTLIHEFNHSFINPLIEKYGTALVSSGEPIYKKEAVKMQRQAYATWQTMMSEALVRASVVKYMESHEQEQVVADKELKQQLNNGFVWLEALVKELGQYERERNRYPTLESYMPRLVAFYDTVAPKINNYEQDYIQHCAEIISVGPFAANDTLVSPWTSEIFFNFDRPLDGERYFFGPSNKGLEHYPKDPKFSFSNNNKTIVMNVSLNPDMEYQINMIGRLMRTADGYAVKPYVLSFKTQNK